MTARQPPLRRASASATERSKARYLRASGVIHRMTLSKSETAALNRLLAARRLGVSALVRQLIIQADETPTTTGES